MFTQFFLKICAVKWKNSEEIVRQRILFSQFNGNSIFSVHSWWIFAILFHLFKCNSPRTFSQQDWIYWQDIVEIQSIQLILCWFFFVHLFIFKHLLSNQSNFIVHPTRASAYFAWIEHEPELVFFAVKLVRKIRSVWYEKNSCNNIFLWISSHSTSQCKLILSIDSNKSNKSEFHICRVTIETI